ncbi:MAG TPA: response regulator, partial [Puia sp.]
FRLIFLKGKAHLRGIAISEEEVGVSPLFQEIVEVAAPEEKKAGQPEDGALRVVSDRSSLLVVDNDPQLLAYVCTIFEGQFVVFQASSGEEGLALAKAHRPDLIISDVHMDGISGIELCETVKNDVRLSHIPVILLTAAASANSKLEGVRHGADDYITKPFDKELLVARVSALLQSRSRLQRYFYDAITLNGSTGRITEEDKSFLDRCIAIVEKHFGEDEFPVRKLAQEMGMSHSNLYQRVKEISGVSVNGFVRYIRLRKAAELFINTDCNVNEAALQVGINDVKYFREQFHKLFGVNPSEFIKKYRKVFAGKYIVKL